MVRHSDTKNSEQLGPTLRLKGKVGQEQDIVTEAPSGSHNQEEEAIS